MSLFKRIGFKKISIAFLLITVLLIGAVVGLLTTQTGIHLIFNGAVRWVPGLDIAKVEGDWRDLRLTDVQFVMPGIEVKVGQLGLGLDFSCLSTSRICVNNLSANEVKVMVDTTQMPPAEPTANSEPLADLSTPYPIELRQLLLNNVQVNVDGTAIKLNHFSTGANWQQRLITLLPTDINGLNIRLSTAVEAPVNPVAEQGVGQSLGEILAPIFAKPLLESQPDFKLPLDIVIEKISAEDLRLVTDSQFVINSLLIRGAIQGSAVRLEAVKINMPEGILSLSGDAQLSENWPVSLTANSTINMAPYKGEKIKLLLGGEMLGELKLDLNLSGPIGAQIKAETSLSTAGLPLSLTLESKKIQWPLTGKIDYLAQDIRLRLTGKATGYNLSMRAGFSGEAIPPAQLTVDGKGNTQQFNLTRMRLSTLEGKAELSGVADWSKAISWNALLVIDGISTDKQWPDWPAKIGGRVTAKGSLYGGNWQLAVPTIDLSGNVKKNGLKILGSAKGNQAGQWQVPKFFISLGPNVFEASGELAEQWNLNVDINAPSLNGTLPGLAGSIIGKLKLRGSASAPQLLADLNATGVKFNNLSIAKVNINGEVTSAAQVSGSLKVLVEQLVQGDSIAIKQISLTASGNEKKHQLDFKASGKPVVGQLHLSGSFDRASEHWRGTINQTRFYTPIGEWRLMQDLIIDYHNKEQRATIGSHCWQNPGAELCVTKAIDAGPSGSANLQLKRFDLVILKPLLDDTQLQGVFTGDVSASWTADGKLPKAKLVLEGKGVEIKQPIEGTPIPIVFDLLKINADLSDQGALLDWRMKIANNGQFNGNVKVSDPQTSRGLSGNITIDNISLNLLKPMLVKGEKAAGAINANLRFGGNAKSPQIYGRFGFDKLSLDGHWIPVTINDSDIVLNFNGTNSTLLGNIKTEKSELKLGGNADWRDINAWWAKITAKGDRIRIDMPPMIKIDVSPDLVFEATPTMLNLSGSVKVPWARISVKELPESAVGVSSDEVMFDNQLKPITAQNSGMQINSNLEIDIGNDVALDAFGLKAKLKGILRIVQNKRGLGIHGQISLPSGRFHAYGQDLVIRKGQLIFVGQAERPQLNIEAVRNPDATEDGVVAGLKVTGFADRPKLEIFSDPALSQEEALSYLLRGQGLNISSEDSDIMTSMLISLGVAQSGKLVGKIGETFGVQNMALDTEGVGDSSKVVLSGYVLPGLQVKYGVGIFDSLATLTLRYRLMPRLYLEAVSGLDQALDLLYQFEF